MNAINECLKTAIKTTPQEVVALNRRMEKIDTQIVELKARRVPLLGMEAHADREIGRKISALQRERAVTQIKSRAIEYPILPTEVLSWRDDKTGWPRLALLSLDEPGVMFKITRVVGSWGSGAHYKRRIEPYLQPKLGVFYKDVLDKLTEMSKESKQTVELAMEFTGIIPATTREKIKVAKTKFTNVYVAAEAKKWNVTKKASTVVAAKPKPVVPTFADPLVLGWDGTNLWLIDHFDMTPLEQYLKDEFAV